MKQRLINFLHRKLLNSVVIGDIITQDKQGNISIGGKLITEDQTRQLIAECKAIEGSDMWNIMNATLKQEALDRGWNKSTNLDHLNAGKTIFYTLDLQSSIIKLIRSREKK